MGIFLFFILNVFGWTEHVEITKVILENVKGLEGSVPYVPLSKALGKTDLEFQKEYKILKGYKFPLKAGEKIPSEIPIKKILSVYSDEPDWGFDQNLFQESQYPEIWREELKYIGQHDGIMSQGFRHMYFPGRWVWSQPLSSFQIPMHAIGEAPDRVELFWKLANNLYQKKEYYWAYRFLAWAIHYSEDLFQPFHTRQIPSVSYVTIDWSHVLPRPNIPFTSEKIGYYHFSYETWLAQELRYENSPLRQVLVTDQRVLNVDPSAKWVIGEIANFSGPFAPSIGRLTTQVFPEFDPAEGKKAEEIVGKETWWANIRENPGQSQMISETSQIFRKMGAVVSSIVEKFIERNALPRSP